MSLLGNGKRGLLQALWTPWVEQLRFRNRPNLQRPLPMHLKRARMMRLCEPIYKEEVKICGSILELQKKKQRQEEELQNNPYKLFLAKELRKRFDSHPMIAFYHENSYTMHEFLRMRGLIHDAKFPMELRLKQNPNVVSVALEGSKYLPAMQICASHTMIGFCQTTDIKKLLAISKKMPKIILMAVAVDGRLLRRTDFEYYAGQTLETARCSLVQTLTAGSRNVHDTLASGVSSVSHSLSNFVNQSKEDTKIS